MTRLCQAPCHPPLTPADINECTSLPQPCRPGFSCINTVGSYTCQRNPLLCGRGYHASPDGTTCVGKAGGPTPVCACLGPPGCGRRCRGRWGLRHLPRCPPQMSMSARRVCTSAGRGRCATTSPAPTAATARPASSRTPSAAPAWVGRLPAPLHLPRGRGCHPAWLSARGPSPASLPPSSRPPEVTVPLSLAIPRLFPSQKGVPFHLSWVPGSLSPPSPLSYLGWGELRAGHPRPPRAMTANPPADVNECWSSPGRLCQHTCENTVGSYRCSCASGFRLAADGKRCEGTRPAR